VERFNSLCPKCNRPVTTGTWACSFCKEHALEIPKACDFCMLREPDWMYPCADFVLMSLYNLPADVSDREIIHSVSRGPWEACDMCHLYIESDLWGEIADRATLGRYPTEIRTAIRAMMMSGWRKFQLHRTGPAQRVEKRKAA